MSHLFMGVDKQLLTRTFTKLRDDQYEHRYDEEDDDDAKLSRVTSQVRKNLGLSDTGSASRSTANAKRFTSERSSDTRTVDEIFRRLGLLEDEE
jgi:hypothetical protein